MVKSCNVNEIYPNFMHDQLRYNPYPIGTQEDTTMKTKLTGIIEKEDDWYVALCPELDVASQGRTVDEARKNLIEALELLFECAPKEEIERRLKEELYITPIEVAYG